MTLPFKSSALRPLTDAEAEAIIGGEGQEIVVVGRRIRGDAFEGYADYGAGGGGSGEGLGGPESGDASIDPADETGEATPPDLDCRDPSKMTPQELRDYRVSQQAARVATEIMAKPDKDTNEYGALIYRDTDGSINHAPVTLGGPTWVQPSFAGIQNWGQVLAMVHSHPAGQFIENDPEFKMYPTPDAAAGGKGDWYAFDETAKMIKSSLETDHGMSPSQASIEVAQFRQYVLGPSGPKDTNQYELHGYDRNDRDRDTLGQKVALALGDCPG
ncbi:MAG TPA: hypothetical protein VGR19_10710 [Allosphingosinicella sp.]|nr:hypothetical protein [Allosphingosinicella sp.]